MKTELLASLAEACRENGGRLYMVGGAVRDRLLGRLSEDVDLTGPLLQEQIKDICFRLGIPCIVMSTQLGTLQIRTGGEVFEYTPFRSETYGIGGRHSPEKVRFGVSLKEDASRRDFTANAIYQDILTGELEDPLNGVQDIQKKELRTCSEDTLSSDALRILRLVRFSGRLGFSIADATFANAKRNTHLLQDIVPERKWTELVKILTCDAEIKKPEEKGIPLPPRESGAVLQCLHEMEELGIWPYLIPQMEEGKTMVQRPDYHAYTVMEHLFHTCACAPCDEKMRLAGLLHDIGKPACLKETGNFHRHMNYGEEIGQNILSAFRCPSAIQNEVVFLIREHMYDIQGTAKEKTVRKRFVTWGRERTERMIQMRETDIRGTGTDSIYIASRWRKLYQTMCQDGTPFTLSELDITGQEIKAAYGLDEGPEIGRILKELQAHCVLKPKDNQRKRLLLLAKHLI